MLFFNVLFLAIVVEFNRSKTEYMECKFNKRISISKLDVKVEDHIIPQVTQFKYLGFVIRNNGEI